MKEGFTIKNEITGQIEKPAFIVCSNYIPDNEVVNWPTPSPEKTRSDVGVWHVKYKANA